MSGSPFDLLGVAPGAGEREIKQAYARLLKQHRPDEDPDGFQRVNEAYRAVLALMVEEKDRVQNATSRPASASAWAAPAPVTAASVPDAPACVDLPASRSASARTADDDGFDFADFFVQLQAYAQGRGPEAVEAWLEAQDVLLRIGRTERVGDQLRAVFADGDPHGFGSEHINAIEEFFNIDTELDLHPKVQALWAVQDGRTVGYGQTLDLPMRQLTRPFNRWQAALVACMPTMTWRIDTLGDDLVRDYGGLPPGIHPEQRAFFARQNDPGYLGPYRWLPILFNSTLPAALVLACGWLLGNVERVQPLAAMFFNVFAGVMTLHALFGWLRVWRMRRWVRRR